MKFLLSLLGVMVVLGVAAAGFVHGGWSAPSYRRVYSAPAYTKGWASYGRGWTGYGGWPGYSSYGSFGGHGGYGYGNTGGGWDNGWSSDWW